MRVHEEGRGTAERTPRVAVIGAGLSGIGTACKLRLAGIETFRIYERRTQVGGTWWANQYPGLNCDVPSRNYQFTFAPNPGWTRGFAPGPEIWRYLDRVATDFGLRDRLSLSTRVTEVVWDSGAWTVHADDGSAETFDFVLSATGVLVEPRIPDIPGLESFAGRAFHSAQWDHDAVVEGRRVAVIGTGSTGMQLIRGLAGVASHLELYQRTAQWVFPLPNRRTTRPGRWALRRFTPKDAPMCKRLVLGTGFYKQFARADVELVDAEIETVTPDGIRTADGGHHPLDVIVLATGFHAQNYMRPMEIVGPGGVRLTELWTERPPYAYRSVALPGFPNLFTLLGPHSPVGNQSLMDIAMTQADFVMGCIERWRTGKLDTLRPTAEATDRFNAELREAIAGTIWASGCDSWYLAEDGVPAVFPWTPSRLREILRDLEPGDWEIERVPSEPALAP